MSIVTKRIASITIKNDCKVSSLIGSFNKFRTDDVAAPNNYNASSLFGSARYFSAKANRSKLHHRKYNPPKFVSDSSGRRFALDTINVPKDKKLKPNMIKRRIIKLRTYQGKEKEIRHSPWRLQLICRHVAGLPVQEALTQLEFLNKVKAPLVQKVLKRTSNLADIRDGLQPSQLEVAECFATHGKHLKRMKIMGRGRMGVMHHRFCHMRVVLREIDFPLKIYTAKTISEKKRWMEHQLTAKADYEARRADREELQTLERMAALKEKERQAED